MRKYLISGGQNPLASHKVFPGRVYSTFQTRESPTPCLCFAAFFTFKGRGSSLYVKGCSNTTAASTFPESGSVRTNSSNSSSVWKPRTGREKHTRTHTRRRTENYEMKCGIQLAPSVYPPLLQSDLGAPYSR